MNLCSGSWKEKKMIKTTGDNQHEMIKDIINLDGFIRKGIL